MQSEEEQRIFDRGVTSGIEAYKKVILEMLYGQLDLQEDINNQCGACKITRQYIDIVEEKPIDEE